MFSAMLEHAKHEVVGILAKVQVQSEGQVTDMENQQRQQGQTGRQFLHPDSQEPTSPEPLAPGQGVDTRTADDHTGRVVQPFVRTTPKVGRNDPCPCGSGKKYKQCHGKL